SAVPGAGAAARALAYPADFVERLAGLAPTLDADRLLLLDRRRTVMFDSSGTARGQVITVTAAQRFANVAEAAPVLDGQRYLAAAVAIAPARDPLRAAFVVVAREQSSVTAA